MTLPTSEQPIVQGKSHGGAPEPGSVIAERVYAAQKAEEGISLGHVRRICDTCGRDWIGPAYCGQGTCRGNSFTEKAVHVTPMVIEGTSGSHAWATALLDRKAKIEVQSDADLELLRALRTQLLTVEQTLLQADAALHRILGRVPLEVEAIFTEAVTLQEKSDREDQMWRNPDKRVWYALQSAVHFAADGGGDIPLGGDAPFRGSLVLQCRHVISEIDQALEKYENALKEKNK